MTALTKFNSLSLKTKIVSAVVLLAVSGIVLLTYIHEKQLTEDMQALLENQQFSAATYIASDLDEKIKQRLEWLEAIAAQFTPELMAKPEAARTLLSQRPALSTLFKVGVVVISKDGQSITDYPTIPGRVGASFLDQDFFHEVVTNGKPCIGKPQVGRFINEPRISFAAPIKDGHGQIVGVLAGLTPMSDPTLFGQVVSGQMGRTGYISISSPTHGVIVTSSDPSRILQPISEPGQNRMFDRFTQGYEGSGIAVNSFGVETLTSAKQIPASGWIVQLVLPTEEAFAPIRKMRKRAYFLAAVSSLAGFCALWLVIRWLLTPLNQASQSVMEMSSGVQPMQALPVKQMDEVGQLLTNFNLLVLERKKIEAELQKNDRFIRTITDNIPAKIGYWDKDLRCNFANSSYLGWFGKTQDEMKNISLIDLLGEDLFLNHEPYIKAVLRGEYPQFERTLTKPDGSTLYNFVHYIPDLDQDDIIGFFVLAADITELKHAQMLLEARVQERTQELDQTVKALEVARDEAEAANSVKTAFMARVSHELRTPLNPIIGMLQLTLDSELSVIQKEYLSAALTAAKDLHQMINELIEFTDLESRALIPGIVGVKALMNSIEQEIGPAARIKGLALHLDMGIHADSIILTDQELLRLVLLKLAENAVKFTRTGNISLAVSFDHESEGQAVFCASVSDTGIGIDPALIPAVISGFTQADDPMRRRFSGVGLGLAVVRRTLQLLEGTMEVESELGKGSTFRVCLPVKDCSGDRLENCLNVKGA